MSIPRLVLIPLTLTVLSLACSNARAQVLYRSLTGNVTYLSAHRPVP
jgi:hypothetical protein